MWLFWLPAQVTVDITTDIFFDYNNGYMIIIRMLPKCMMAKFESAILFDVIILMIINRWN